MKITLLMFILLTLTVATSAQLASERNKEKIHVQEPKVFNKSSVKQLIEYSKEYSLPFTKQGLKAGSQKQKLDSIEYSYLMDDGSFLLAEKDNYEYDQSGLNVASSYYEWNEITENLMLTSKQEISYVNGNLDEAIGYSLNFETGTLDKSGKTKFQYTSNELIDNISYYEWDSEMQVWFPLLKQQFTYNESQMVSTTVFSIPWDTEEIVLGKSEYYYGDQSELIKTEDYSNNYELGIMELTSLTEYEYQNNLLTSETYSELDYNAEMQYYERYLYTYSNNGTISSELDEYYNPETSDWVSLFRNDYTYSDILTYENTQLPAEYYFDQGTKKYFINGIPEKFEGYTNVDGAGTWIKDVSGVVYYSDVETKVTELSTKNWVIYPNPANNVIYLNSTIAGTANCKLINFCGQVISEQQVQNGNSIDMSSVKPGCYFLQINDNTNNQQTIKVIKQ